MTKAAHRPIFLTPTGEGLFEEPTAPQLERAERLAQTIDRIRERYGSKAIMPANILGNDLGIRDKDE